MSSCGPNWKGLLASEMVHINDRVLNNLLGDFDRKHFKDNVVHSTLKEQGRHRRGYWCHYAESSFESSQGLDLSSIIVVCSQNFRHQTTSSCSHNIFVWRTNATEKFKAIKWTWLSWQWQVQLFEHYNILLWNAWEGVTPVETLYWPNWFIAKDTWILFRLVPGVERQHCQ